MKIFIILLSLSITISINANLGKAVEQYEAGNLESAFQKFKSLAVIGEKRAQLNLGIMYYYGEYVAKDINQSYAWMKLSVQSETINNSHKKIFERIASQVSDIEMAEKEYIRLANLYSSEALLETLYPVLIKPTGDKSFETQPINIKEPKWPLRALKKGIQGIVRVQFDIDKKGIPRNTHILESLPKDIFNRASLKAVARWRFKPKIDANGKPVHNNGLRYTMEYRFEEFGKIEIKQKLYDETLTAAKNGDALAQYYIGYWEKRLKGSKSEINPNEWFLKAAVQGVKEAQYEVGRSLVYGTGCFVDKGKGLDWLTRSAGNGGGQAKMLLGSIASIGEEFESQQTAIEYLKGVDKLTPSAKLAYSWMLITSPYPEIANPKKGLSISSNFSKKEFNDDITIYELKAAAYAALGNFKKAVSYQEDALDEAEDMNADLDIIKTRLINYQDKQTWF